jgi:hypothetical protein
MPASASVRSVLATVERGNPLVRASSDADVAGRAATARSTVTARLSDLVRGVPVLLIQ